MNHPGDTRSVRLGRFSSASLRASEAKVVATVEARMGSSRLPGKVASDICGVPMLQMVVERIRRSQTVEIVCVATTDDPADDETERLARSCGAEVFRGSEDDVLGRVLGAARSVGGDVVVEATGDCPFVDATIIDACVLAYFGQDVHLVTANVPERTFPLGLDMKVFSTELLAEADRMTEDPADREHVSLWMYEPPSRCVTLSLRAPSRLARPGYRLTVDTDDDLHLVSRVVASVGHWAPAAEVVAFLDRHPEIVEINRQVPQKSVR
jgi:spore coat polysaccharide biosynthesis protein SpsF